MTRSILCGNVCSALAQYSFSPAHLFARPAQYPQQQFIDCQYARTGRVIATRVEARRAWWGMIL